MSLATAIILLVVAQRLAELVYARRNTKRLLARGGKEYGAGHYPLIVLLHAAWLASLAWFAPGNPANVWLLGMFLVLQLARLWVLVTLGEQWTTRVIVLPQAPLVRTGPYRYLNHPNYLVVVAEIALLPLVFGLWHLALLFSILNAIILTHRVRIENAALQTDLR